MKRFKKNNKGFSLVELIVVIAIMAVLGVAIALAVTQFIPQANRSTDLNNANSLKIAAESAITDALSNGESVESSITSADLLKLIDDKGTLGAQKADDVKTKGTSETYGVKADQTFTLEYDGKSVTVSTASTKETSKKVVLAGEGVKADYKTAK